MNTRVVIAAIVGGIASFVLGGIVYGVLGLDAFMKSHTVHYDGLMMPMDSTMLIHVFIGGLCNSLLLAYIFANWAKIKDFNGGMKAGALIGLLMTLGFDIFMKGYMNLWDYTSMFTDVIVSSIMTSFSAGIIAWMLGRLQPKVA